MHPLVRRLLRIVATPPILAGLIVRDLLHPDEAIARAFEEWLKQHSGGPGS
jgi:hypothetical protein